MESFLLGWFFWSFLTLPVSGLVLSVMVALLAVDVPFRRRSRRVMAAIAAGVLVWASPCVLLLVP